MDYKFENAQIFIKNENDFIKVIVEGHITEDFIQEQIVIDENWSKVVFDVNEVTMLNSCGIREWIKFINRFSKNSSLVYINVPRVFVTQMNIVQGFLSDNAKVLSFYAPYYDENNDEEVLKLLESSEIIDGKAPVVTGDDGSELEFDAIEKTYFRFLNIA